MTADPPPAIIPVDLGPRAREAGIRAAFTTRAAGNFGLDVGDDPGSVHARRAGLRGWAGREVLFADHVHGTNVLDGAANYPSEPIGDAWVTNAPAALAVLSADCLPILSFDVEQRVIGAAHAGRVGLLAGILPATTTRMRELGATDIRAVIGPGICGACYEIFPKMAEELMTHDDAGWALTTSHWGTPSLDLQALARTQLERLGVTIVESFGCTLEDPRFFSHRSTDRFNGRQAGLLALTPRDQR